ncbi:MAG: S1C family serine protease [Candidatus Kerfeldbacteria bacterium]
MKARVSPTSPKSKKNSNTNNEKQLDDYYKNTLKSIDKPDKLRSKSSIGFLVVVIIIGFMAGILGQITLLSYGSDIPYLEKLDIFSWTNPQSLFVSNRSNNELTSDKLQKVVTEVNSSMVQIFEYKEQNNTLESLYVPEEILGFGFVLTNDGYIITTSDITTDYEKLVIITNQKEVYLVNNTIIDSATDFIFLKTDAIGLQTLDIVDNDSLTLMSDILLTKTYGFDHSIQSQQAMIIDKNFSSISNVNDFVKSSEKFYSNILLNDIISDSFNNSIAFTFEKDAIGMVKKEGDNFVILPFSYIKNSILNLLENNEINRPYLGINYVNLSLTVNLSTDLSNGAKKGILVYSNNEVDYPSVVEGSPAHKSGVKTNDIITAIDDHVLNGNTFFGNIILSYEPQDIVTLSIVRGEEEIKIKVTLEEIL